MKAKFTLVRSAYSMVVLSTMLAFALAGPVFGQTTGPMRITLDDAIQMALQHNHNLLAARTTIQQSQAEETTANLRPNPVLFTDWDYLPYSRRASSHRLISTILPRPISASVI